jgi:hypothetical protein
MKHLPLLLGHDNLVYDRVCGQLVVVDVLRPEAEEVGDVLGQVVVHSPALAVHVFGREEGSATWLHLGTNLVFHYFIL